MSISAPDAVMNVSSATVEYESAQVPQRMPPELFATTPPTVAMSVDAGSGPSLRPCGARTRFAWPSTVPGLTRARAPSSSTSTPRQCRRTSTRIPSVWLWPFRLVPPARNVTGMPCSRP